jgi:hypothetical protein
MNKREIIENNKLLLQELISKTITSLNENINIIDIEYKINCKFIQFINTINVFETYKWNLIKINYNNIKKNITVNKNNSKKIIKLYSDIINYYEEKEIECINKQIQQINNLNSLVIINFQELKLKHNEIIIKNKNSKILKIHKQNNNIDNLIIKIFNLHIDLKKCKKN